jgi:uncharacterized membrane protein
MTADAETVPSSREFTLLGVTYGLYALGLVIFWPAVVGLILAYVKRGDARGSIIESHYGWLIRTFWWWVGWFTLAVVGMVVMVLPGAIEMGRKMEATQMLSVPWQLIGGAIAGGTVILLVWFWVVYRLLRGTLRLADGRAVP